MERFTVKAEGPPGCGKTTFLNLLIATFKYNGNILIVNGKEHELIVTMLGGAFPREETK